VQRAWEILRIVIDLISFFLVTLDLYGEQNVENLTNTLQLTLEWLKGNLGLASRAVLGLPEPVTMPQPESPADVLGRRRPFSPPLPSAQPTWQMILAALRPLILPFWFAWAGILGAYGIAAIGLFLVRRFKAKGAMLITGASLFAFEKIVDLAVILRH
jgi:hypothetical protein